VNLAGSWLLTSLLVGSLGVGLVVYGKRETRLPQLLAGLLLLIDSAVAPTATWMLVGSGLVVATLWGLLRAGL